jgi:hypothetical protein
VTSELYERFVLLEVSWDYDQHRRTTLGLKPTLYNTISYCNFSPLTQFDLSFGPVFGGEGGVSSGGFGDQFGEQKPSLSKFN